MQNTMPLPLRASTEEKNWLIGSAGAGAGMLQSQVK
jgi:hypothetical protein